MKPVTKHDKPATDETASKQVQHEQEDAASRDYKHQREGGFKKKNDEKTKQTPP